MRSKLYIAILIISSSNIWAQDTYEYIPLLEEGKQWVIENRVKYYTGDNYVYNSVITYDGEDTLNGEKVIRLEYQELKDEGISKVYYLKEENRKIYYWEEFYPEWIIKLDFNCKKGEYTDFSYIYSEEGDFIYDEGFVNINGINRRWLDTHPGNWDNSCYWIEGIGAPTMELLSPFPIPACDPPMPGVEKRILKCYKNNELLYSCDDNYVYSMVSDVQESYINEKHIYDLLGCEVKNVLPGSVYIRNGKKFIGK